jgi:hypothetical protein
MNGVMDEISSLVEYVALYHAPDEASITVWPTRKNEQFWNKCAEAVNCSNQETNRTGKYLKMHNCS